MTHNFCSVRGSQAAQSPVTIVIYGAGGFARETAQLIKDAAATGIAGGCAGFLVDDAFRQPERAGQLPVLGNAEWLRNGKDVALTVAIGSPAARRRIVERIERDFDVPWLTLIIRAPSSATRWRSIEAPSPAPAPWRWRTFRSGLTRSCM